MSGPSQKQNFKLKNYSSYVFNRYPILKIHTIMARQKGEGNLGR